LVLLHHGLGSTRAWKKQVPALVEAGWRVIVYDRWGYGKSDARNGIDMPLFDQDQNDLLNVLNLHRLKKVTLIGHSDGGTISLYFAARFPEKVSALVTIAAHIYYESKMEPGIESIRYTWDHDPSFRRAFHQIHGEKFESVFFNWYDGWHSPESIGWDMRPLLTRINCPSFIIQGDQDEHATPQHAIDLAACIPDAELWIAEGAAHMLPQEEPEAFNIRLLDFLHRCSGPANV
jgi:pimeloyl-ACP methyl ester carboxylesterase